MTEEFNKWWDEDDLTTQGNPYTYGTPVYWAWEGWQAALAAPVQHVADAWMHKDGRMTDAKAKTARAENFHGWRPMAFIASTTPPAQPAYISPKQLLALAQEANLGLDKVIEVFRMAAPVQEEDLYDLAVKADNWGQP
jgi:hypothetical protein